MLARHGRLAGWALDGAAAARTAAVGSARSGSCACARLAGIRWRRPWWDQRGSGGKRSHCSLRGPVRCSVAEADLSPSANLMPPKGIGTRTKPVLQVSLPLYDYILAHTHESEVLEQLREETSSLSQSGMQISPEQGQLMRMLLELMGAERCIEVGVFTGYSSVVIATAIPEHGRLVALDKDEDTMAVARRYFQAAGVAHKVEPIVGDAVESLDNLLARGDEGSYDFAFLDADKRAYPVYFEKLMLLLRPGGVVVVDNVLWKGRVVDPKDVEARTEAVRQFNDFLFHDSRVATSMIPVGDGMTICRKL